MLDEKDGNISQRRSVSSALFCEPAIEWRGSCQGLACGLAASGRAEAAPGEAAGGLQVVMSDEEWRQVLSKDAYRVLRDRKTERAGTSPLNLNKAAGTYRCAGCGKPLFPSATKFNSGTGWPSFYEAFPGAVDLTVDKLYVLAGGAMEVRCRDCGGHLLFLSPSGRGGSATPSR